MKKKIFGIGIGVIIIFVSGTLLAAKLGLIGIYSILREPGFLLFTTCSTIFFLIYFLHGIRKWGWLFPALFTASLAVVIGMEQGGMDNEYTPAILFGAWSLPFFAGYIINRKRWLLALGIFFILFAAFLVITSSGLSEWSGIIFFGMLAVAFLSAFFLLNLRWWLFLFAGGSASIGMVTTLESLLPIPVNSSISGFHINVSAYVWVLILGLAVTCGIIWLLRKSQPTGWAIFPAGGLLMIGILAFLLGARFQVIGLVAALSILGMAILVSQILRLLSHPQRSQSGLEEIKN